METKTQKQIITDFLKSKNRLITSNLGSNLEWNKINVIDLNYSDVEMLKIVIPKLCEVALEQIVNLSSDELKDFMVFQVMELLDFYSKMNLEKEMEFLDSLISTKDNKEIENFFNQEEPLLRINGFQTQIGCFDVDFNNAKLENLRINISNVCKYALAGSMFYNNDVDKGTIYNYVGILLSFSSKIHFEIEARFLDEIIESKKKQEIENPELNIYPHYDNSEKPKKLFFYSDDDAVDPEYNNLKEKV